MPVSTTDRFDDEFAHFRLKHGTYWRWIRPVFGGPTRSEANARIEFRPLAGQPTVRDSVAFQAAFGAAVVGLRHAEHPVGDLDWEIARRNFYRAARDGLDAELEWIDVNGESTTRRERLYRDLFEHARDGLTRQGFGEEASEQYLSPLRDRIRSGVTPASWKRRQVRDALDAGESFEDAVHTAQRAYIDKQRETLLSGSFSDWIRPE